MEGGLTSFGEVCYVLSVPSRWRIAAESAGDRRPRTLKFFATRSSSRKAGIPMTKTNIAVAKYNQEKQGVELYFQEYPGTKVIKQLKENAYRWHNVKKCWYSKIDSETLKIARKYAEVNIQEQDIPEVKITRVKKEKPVQELDGLKLGMVFIRDLGFKGEEVCYKITKILRKDRVQVQTAGFEPENFMVRVSAKGTKYIQVGGSKCPLKTW